MLRRTWFGSARSPRVTPVSRAVILLPFVALSMVAGACSASDAEVAAVPDVAAVTEVDSAPSPVPETSSPEEIATTDSQAVLPVAEGKPTAPRTAKATPTLALSALLAAEMERDHGISFDLLTTQGLAKYPTLDAWADRQTELPQITGFSDVKEEGEFVSALVNHKPGIDPFVGLQFASERQTWRAGKTEAGWLLDPDPVVEPVLPPIEKVGESAAKWLEARKACNVGGAEELQAVPNLFGVSVGGAALCGSTSTYTAGPPGEATTSPETAILVGQYGPSIVRYTKTLEVVGGTDPFTVFLVPIGDQWRVIAVND